MNLIDVVFRNDDFLVVNKPENLNFHSENSPGLVVLLQKQLGVESLFPVHRLDKMTSGLILFALHKSAAQALSRLFAERKMQKFYIALADGKPKKKQGWIKGDMLPARRGSWKLAQTQDNPAITQFVSVSIAPNQRLYLLKLHTGKTHQIRVAMKSLGVPILGDARYQASEAANKQDCGYLHAFAMKFEFNGQIYEFVLPPRHGKAFLTDVVQQQCEQWMSPWHLF